MRSSPSSPLFPSPTLFRSQWWWRRSRASDSVPQVFWVDDDDGPVAAALLTSWPRGHWQADALVVPGSGVGLPVDRKSTRLNSSHVESSYAAFCLKKKK